VPERDVGIVVLAHTDREVVTPGQRIPEWLVTR
jgi:hypothetical protein